MKKGIWKNQEVKELFKTVEEIKNSNKSLKEAFIEHAKKFNRKPNSVRNYYYHEVDNLSSDKDRLKKLAIDLSKHKKSEIVYFTENEENELLQEIDKLVKNGVSVRQACLKLSKGDISLMLRYQNKYRNYLAKNSIKEEKDKSNNIIKFTNKKTTISDNDIQALFMGLVRLVKRNAQEEVESKNRILIEKANQQLRSALLDISGKEKQIKMLKESFVKIKEEKGKLEQELFKLKCDKANKLRQKLNKLENRAITDNL